MDLGSAVADSASFSPTQGSRSASEAGGPQGLPPRALGGIHSASTWAQPAALMGQQIPGLRTGLGAAAL